MARIDWVRLISIFSLIGVGLCAGKVLFEDGRAAGRKEERRKKNSYRKIGSLKDEILKMAEEFETKEENKEV